MAGKDEQRIIPCPVCNWQLLFRRANLPYVTLGADDEPVWDRPFDARNLADPALYRKVERFGKHIGQHVAEGRGVLLWGESGGGKTRLASMIGMAAVRAGISTRMSTLVGILDRVKAGFEDNTADAIWASWRDDTRLLILDDLGAENRSSDWVPERVFDLFDHRIKARLPLIITTKYDPAHLGRRIAARDEQVGTSIVSRLKELCNFAHVEAKADYRDIINRSTEAW